MSELLPLAIAQMYRRKGWFPIPVYPRSKRPVVPFEAAWTEQRLDGRPLESAFSNANLNVGVLLGASGLVDIDLDDDNASLVAPFLLPPTVTFGRTSRKKSHYLYACLETESKKHQYNGKTIAEVRSKGCQTVFPGSTHVSGEAIDFDDGQNELAEIDPSTAHRLGRVVSAAALLLPQWRQGSRHDLSLGLSGALIKSGWNLGDTMQLIDAVAAAAGDEERDSRGRNVLSTWDRYLANQPTTGWPRLTELLGTDLVQGLRKLLVTAASSATYRTAGVDELNNGEAKADAIDADSDPVAAANAGIEKLVSLPKLYQRRNRIVTVTESVETRLGTKAKFRSHSIQTVALPTLSEFLCQCATWVGSGKGGKQRTLSRPPEHIVRAIHARGTWDGLRPLVAITDTPVLRPDGTISRAGYDSMTGLYQTQDGDDAIPPSVLTVDDATQAMCELVELLSDFPFANDAHKATALAALLAPFARHAISGPMPFHLYDANMPAAGKTLLMEIVAQCASGEAVGKYSYVSNNDEMRKRITTVALNGTRIVMFDNIREILGGQALEAALTTPVWSDRILGGNEEARCPLVCVWSGTGNNVSLTTDMTRRTLLCRLESCDEIQTRGRISSAPTYSNGSGNTDCGMPKLRSPF